MEEIFIRIVPLPYTVKAVTAKDSDDNYNIYINERLSRAERYKACTHELIHISNGDFFSDKSVTVMERRVHEAEKILYKIKGVAGK